jgi:hypothetical protein
MGAVKLMQYMLIFHTCLHSPKASETDCSCNPACLCFDEYKFKMFKLLYCLGPFRSSLGLLDV